MNGTKTTLCPSINNKLLTLSYRYYSSTLTSQIASVKSCTQRIHDWLLNYGLNSNPSKSKAVAFYNPRSEPLAASAESIGTVSVAGSPIKLQTSIKNLGVYLAQKCPLISRCLKHTRLAISIFVLCVTFAPAIQFIHILICFHWHMARHQLCIIIIIIIIILSLLRLLKPWMQQ